MLPVYCIKRPKRNYDMNIHWNIPWKMNLKKKIKKQQQQDDDKQYDTFLIMKLVYQGISAKVFSVNSSLNGVNTRFVTRKLTPHIDTRTSLIYLFKSEMHWIAIEILDFIKELTSSPCMFTSFEEIHGFIEEYEEKRLELGKADVQAKAYLPSTRVTNTKDNY